MKLKYIGESFGVDSLTNGNIYEAEEENGMFRVIDDSGEDYLYSKENPAPLDRSCTGGIWEIVEIAENRKNTGTAKKAAYGDTLRKNKKTDVNIAIAGK